MFPDDQITGWNATDDEVSVPVRSSAVPIAEKYHTGPATDITHESADQLVLRHQSASRSQNSMRLSALFGVMIVLGTIGFTVGLGNLFGDLTGGSDAQTTTIEITAEGVFSPDAITVRHGNSLTLTNKNPDPQVIKSKDGRVLFPIQVLFDQPFIFTVPSDANGIYTYFSETLPDDKQLTITVTTEVIFPTTAASSSSSPQASFEIPLPFGDSVPITTPTETLSAASVSSASSVSVQKTEHSGDTVTISLPSNGSVSSSQSSDLTFTTQIPTNPYTVASGLQHQTITAKAKNAQNLHSGAPLQQLVKHRPATITLTGPEGIYFLFLTAMLAVTLLYRKLTVA